MMKLKRYLLGLIACLAIAVLVVLSQIPTEQVEGAAGQADAEAAKSNCEVARDGAVGQSDMANGELAFAEQQRASAMEQRDLCTDEESLTEGDAYIDDGDNRRPAFDQGIGFGDGWFAGGNGLFGVADFHMTNQDWDKAIYFFGLSTGKYDTALGHYMDAHYAASAASGDFFLAEQAYMAGAGMPGF